MKMLKQKSEGGFTLLELMVAMAVGLIALSAMASLFKTAMNSVMLVTQRAETQQNMRAAIDLMVKDISMAGAGLPSGGRQLPAGGGSHAPPLLCAPTRPRPLPRPCQRVSHQQLYVRDYSRLQQWRRGKRNRARGAAAGDQRQYHLHL